MVRDASTPFTYERTTLNTHGAAMGWYLSAKKFSRMRSQKTPIANLYQAGHWTFPGGGVPMVIISGVNAAMLVLKGMKKFTPTSRKGDMS
jgi:prolycopene isomerase